MKQNQGKSKSEQSTYYTWRTETVSLFDEQYTIVSKPGMPESGARDPATLLLAEYIEVDEGETLLNLNCGSGFVGTIGALLSVDGKVVLADSSVVAAEAARRTLEENGVKNAEVVCSDGVSYLDELASVDPTPVDVVAIRLPKGKQPTVQLLWDGFRALKPGGRLYLTGANGDGIKSYLRHMEDLFGNGQLISYRKGCRVGMATKQEKSPPTPETFAGPWLDHKTVHQFDVSLANQSFSLCSRPGVFSWDRLDAGSRVLIETMQINPTDRVLELGCGYGVVGLFASGKATSGAITMVDADIRAVEAARMTVTKNDASNCTVLLADCALELEKSAFDVVVTNAPFHQGMANQYDVAHQFIHDAARVLKRGGRFYLVANQFIPYEEQMTYEFGDVETAYADGKFKVLGAQK